jgi:DNA-directed RNA polymerase specialized sigma24 family protein
MDDPAIIGVGPEEWIPEARSGNKEALRLLLISPWLGEILDEVSGKTAWEFNVDSEEVRDYVFERIRIKIRKLKNPQDKPWVDCLTSWCYRVAERRALNILRHRGVEESYCDRISHEHTINIRGRQRNAALCSSSISQEEEIEQKKRIALQAKMRQTAQQVFRSLEPEDAEIISMWSDGKKLREISAATRIPISTVNYKQKELLKSFVKEIEKVVVKEIGKTKAEKARVRRLLKDMKECSAGFRQLIGNSLREMVNAATPSAQTHGLGSMS